MPGKLKVGIIGAGFISGLSHVPAIRKLGDRAEVTALADNREDAVKHMAKRYGIDRTYTDPLEMLEKEKLDLVHVCTANNTHKEFTIAALRSGANVICEKPLALSLRDARDMFGEADKAGKLLVACQNNRFGPMQEVKRLYETGELGEVYFVEIENIRSRGVPPWGRFHIAAENGHGPMCDVGVHFLDASLFALGNPAFKSVTADTFTKLSNKEDTSVGSRGTLEGDKPYLPRFDYDYRDFDVEDFFTGTARFENGMQIQMRFAWAANLPGGDFYRIAGTKAGLIFEKNKGLENPLSIHRFDGAKQISRDIELPIKGTMVEMGHMMLIEHVADVLQRGAECVIKRDEMLNVCAIMEALYRSAEYGREVTYAEITKGEN